MSGKIKITFELTHEEWSVISSVCYQQADEILDDCPRDEKRAAKITATTLSNFSEKIDTELKAGSL